MLPVVRSFPPSVRKNGNTWSLMTSYISLGAKCLNRPQRSSWYSRPRASLPSGKIAALYRLLPVRSAFASANVCELVQPAKEQEIRDLLDDLEGIGDASRPEGIPHLSTCDFRVPVTTRPPSSWHDLNAATTVLIGDDRKRRSARRPLDAERAADLNNSCRIAAPERSSPVDPTIGCRLRATERRVEVAKPPASRARDLADEWGTGCRRWRRR